MYSDIKISKIQIISTADAKIRQFIEQQMIADIRKESILCNFMDCNSSTEAKEPTSITLDDVENARCWIEHGMSKEEYDKKKKEEMLWFRYIIGFKPAFSVMCTICL